MFLSPLQCLNNCGGVLELCCNITRNNMGYLDIKNSLLSFYSTVQDDHFLCWNFVSVFVLIFIPWRVFLQKTWLLLHLMLFSLLKFLNIYCLPFIHLLQCVLFLGILNICDYLSFHKISRQSASFTYGWRCLLSIQKLLNVVCYLHSFSVLVLKCE